MELISLKDALDEIDSGKPFSIQFTKADRRRKTGGEQRFYKDCKLSKQVSAKEKPIPQTGIKREVKHRENGTRNILLPNGNIRTVHIRLIEWVNGKKVTY